MNITVAEGDGYSGYPQEAPFDRIILTAAPPLIPEVLIDELKPTGILVAPVGVETQDLVVMKKTPGGRITTRSIIPVSFVPMTTMHERSDNIHNGREGGFSRSQRGPIIGLYHPEGVRC